VAGAWAAGMVMTAGINIPTMCNLPVLLGWTHAAQVAGARDVGILIACVYGWDSVSWLS